MSQNINQSELIPLHAFDNEEDSMLDAINSINSENDFDYLQKCVSSLESKDSGINLSPESVSVASSDLHLEHLDDYNNTNHDLHNVDMRFMKGKNVFLDSKIIDDDLSKRKEDPNSKNDSEASLSLHEESNGIHEYVVNSENVINYHLLDTSPITDNFEHFEDPKFLGTIDESLHKRSTLEDYSITPSSSESYFRSKKYLSNESDAKETGVEINTTEKKTLETNKKSINKDLELKVCSQCPMTFKYKRHFDRHMEGHEKNNCSHCNAKFARRKHLDVHLYRIHGESTNNRYPYSCDICLRNFPKKVLLNRHRTKHHFENGNVCSQCGEIIKTDAEMQQHKLKHEKEKQFQCMRCSHLFSTEQTFRSHIQNHDNYKCSKCDASFASKKAFSKHFRLAHSTKNQDVKPMKDGLYFCTDCCQSFMNKSGYCRHLLTAMHLSKVNQQPPASASCPVCKKILTTRQACVQHIRRVHRGDKKFVCDAQGCSFQCAYKNDLEKHKQLHVEERNVVCEYCGKAFTSISILKDHILYVHNKERQFVCEECGKAFKRNSLLNRHKLSHQQLRPYACGQCSAAFKRSHHRTRHMESCHRLTSEKKRKKTEGGDLILVPEQFKKTRPKKSKVQKKARNLEIQKELNLEAHSSLNQDSLDDQVSTQTQSSSNSLSFVESPRVSIEMPNNLLQTEAVSEVVSLVDINSGQVVTVEVTNQDSLPIDDIVSQFEESCNEMPAYQDLEFQNEILNRNQSFYDNANYSELQLEEELITFGFK